MGAADARGRRRKSPENSGGWRGLGWIGGPEVSRKRGTSFRGFSGGEPQERRNGAQFVGSADTLISRRLSAIPKT